MPLPADYPERVYAGVLGKIIGVYLGRPVEGWSYDRIRGELGEITYYLNERLGLPLVVADDDISGTFTFLRALEDALGVRQHPSSGEPGGAEIHLPTPADIGQTWLNYVIDNRTTLWWGGEGVSTEHTAYLNLKRGLRPPESGSAAVNGKLLSEQIGAQIFVDGWAMAAPGDPQLAADLAWRAACVSHDGEAVYGAQVLAAMEAQAFVEPDVDTLIDTGLSVIPKNSVIYRLIQDVREWHAKVSDWRKARRLLEARYGPSLYPGAAHVIPNQGVIQLSLQYGDGDFQKSILLACNAGWDTDCNAGSVGCLLGIRNGLKGMQGGRRAGGPKRCPGNRGKEKSKFEIQNPRLSDWRGPLADRLYVVSADGGGAITDALRESMRIASIGYALAGETFAQSKGGARFHFEMPGAVQGFRAGGCGLHAGRGGDREVGSRGGRDQGSISLTANPQRPGKSVWLENVEGHSRRGARSLAIGFRLEAGQAARVGTPTFIPVEGREMPGYELLACPTLYPGQVVRSGVWASEGNRASSAVSLCVGVYGPDDELNWRTGPEHALRPGEYAQLEWQVPDTGGQPVAEVGLVVTRGWDPREQRGRGAGEAAEGTIHLDWLTWEGTPVVTLGQPAEGGTMWRRAWVNGVDTFETLPECPYLLRHSQGTGLLIQGTRDWQDYEVSAVVTPRGAAACGIAARVQGMRRYYALLLCQGGTARLVKAGAQRREGEGGPKRRPGRWGEASAVVAEADLACEMGRSYRLALQVEGNGLRGAVDGVALFDLRDEEKPLEGGAAALVCSEGEMEAGDIRIRGARRVE